MSDQMKSILDRSVPKICLPLRKSSRTKRQFFYGPSKGQPHLVVHETLYLRKLLVGWKLFFFLAQKMGMTDGWLSHKTHH